MEFLTIFLSELIGTFLLIVIGCGVNAGVNLKKTYSNDSGWIVITFGWGIAVVIGATVALPSGGHLNPAVTISQASLGIISVSQALMYIFAELVGAFLGSLMIILLYWSHFKATEKDEGLISGSFYTSPAISNKFINLTTEIVATFVLVMAVMSTIMYNPELTGSNASFVMFGPLFVGFVVIGIGLALGGLTGYSINPARDLMPRLAHYILPIPNKGKTNWSYSWIPTIGPIIGGLIASLIVFFVVLISGGDIVIPNLNIKEVCY